MSTLELFILAANHRVIHENAIEVKRANSVD